MIELRRYKINKLLGNECVITDKIVDILYKKLSNLHLYQECGSLVSSSELQSLFASEIQPLSANTVIPIGFHDKRIQRFFAKYHIFNWSDNCVYVNGNHFDLEIPNLSVFNPLVLCIINELYNLNLDKIIITYD